MVENFKKIERKFEELGITSETGILPDDPIVSIEQEFGFGIPLEYKEFLIKYGRLNFTHRISYSLLSSNPKSIERGKLVSFYDLVNDEYSLEKNVKTYFGRMPKNLIPIAECPGGDQLCIGVNEEVRGKIYFWGHDQETFDPSEEELWNNVYLVADSFVEFILSFQVINDDETPKDLGIVKVTTTPEFLALVEKFKNKK